MDWLEKAKQAVAGIGREVGRQADVLGLHNEIGKLQEEIDRNYAEAGRRARQLVRERQLLDGEIRTILKRIDEAEAQIMELRKQLRDSESGAGPAPAPDSHHQCGQCGANVAADTRFCPNCGARQT